MPNSVRDRIAAEVRAELGRQSRTQAEVAEALGLPGAVVSLRLRGKRSFKAEEIATVAQFLGVPVAQLIPELPAVDAAA